jgi:hypothetical protein
MRGILPNATGVDVASAVGIDPAALTVTREKIAAVLGYREQTLPEHFADCIDAALERLSGKCTISAGYRIVSVSEEPHRRDGLTVNGTFYTMQPIITSQLRGADRAALFVCTIGSAMEEWAAELFMQGDAVNGHFVDTIASAAVENAADLLHAHVEELMRKSGLNVTNRYSPGYCGWLVSEQKYLFASLPEAFCGITLTDTSLMVPKKSVSGIIGIGKTVKRKPYFCDRCGNETCSYHTFLSSKNRRGKKDD